MRNEEQVIGSAIGESIVRLLEAGALCEEIKLAIANYLLQHGMGIGRLYGIDWCLVEDRTGNILYKSSSYTACLEFAFARLLPSEKKEPEGKPLNVEQLIATGRVKVK